jgi:hypothetical protein
MSTQKPAARRISFSVAEQRTRLTIPEQTSPGFTLLLALENSSSSGKPSSVSFYTMSGKRCSLSNGDVSVNFACNQLSNSMNSAKPVPPPRMIAYPEDWGKYASNTPFAIFSFLPSDLCLLRTNPPEPSILMRVCLGTAAQIRMGRS